MYGGRVLPARPPIDRVGQQAPSIVPQTHIDKDPPIPVIAYVAQGIELFARISGMLQIIAVEPLRHPLEKFLASA